jgi:hypothetical protein
MALSDLLVGELRSGLTRLVDTRVSAVVPVYRTVVQELLPLVPGLPAGVAVSLGADQHVQVRFGSFFANAALRPDIIVRPAPVVTLELASQLVAWGLQRASLPPFVRVSGRLVQIWLAEIPALADMAPLWPHVDRLTCTSTPSGLEIRADLHIKATGEPPPARRPILRSRGDRPMTDGRLQAWLRNQVAAGLPALAGARVAGTVPVPVTLLNDLIAQAVADAAEGRPNREAPTPGSAVDVAMMARMVRHLRVDAAPGVVTLDFEIGVDG